MKVRRTHKCVRCERIYQGLKSEGHKLGWRFMGPRLNYCPEHKQFQFSLMDRDV